MTNISLGTWMIKIAGQYTTEFVPLSNQKQPPEFIPLPNENYLYPSLTQQLNVKHWPKKAREWAYYEEKGGWIHWSANGGWKDYFKKEIIDKREEKFITAASLVNLFEFWALFIYIQLGDASPSTVDLVNEIWEILWQRGTLANGYLSIPELDVIVAQFHARDQNIGLLCHVVRRFALRKIALYIYIYIYSRNITRG